jgi:hypothetical protein
MAEGYPGASALSSHRFTPITPQSVVPLRPSTTRANSPVSDTTVLVIRITLSAPTDMSTVRGPNA